MRGKPTQKHSGEARYSRVELEPALLARVKREASRLRDELSHINTIAAQIDALENRETALAEELAAGESRIDPLDAGAVRELAVKRDQLVLIRRKLDRLRRDFSFERALRQALRPVPDLVRACLKGTFEKVVGDAASAFAPFFFDDNRARVMATQCDAAMSLRAFMSLDQCTWPGEETASQILEIVDQLERGENPWKFFDK